MGWGVFLGKMCGFTWVRVFGIFLYFFGNFLDFFRAQKREFSKDSQQPSDAATWHRSDGSERGSRLRSGDREHRIGACAAAGSLICSGCACGSR